MATKENKKWEVISHTWATGGDDYDGCWELTNGEIGICTKDDDDIVEEGLKQAADALNKTGASFYQMEGKKELDLLEENAKLKEELRQEKEKAIRILNALKTVIKFVPYGNNTLSDAALEVANKELSGCGQEEGDKLRPEGWPFVCHVCGEQDCESDHK